MTKTYCGIREINCHFEASREEYVSKINVLHDSREYSGTCLLIIDKIQEE